MSAAVAYAPNRYSRVQMNTASLNDAPTRGWVCSLNLGTGNTTNPENESE